MKLIYEKSRPGRRASTLPRHELPVPEVPEELARGRPPRLPEISEPELVRHFTALADRTFGVDTGFYPLGSCTMKHNPRVHERLAGLPGFRDLHPHQEDEAAQGALELMFRLQEMLAEIAGLPAVTLQPAAGSQGELTGLMLMRAYFADRGEERDTIITPDTAHGTNPASVTMAGYKLEKIETDARGNLDLDDLRGKVSERTAGLMLTNPSTLGLFDEGIEEVASIFHDAGALLYYDGANLNAVVGISRPGDMGFDIVHYNLHKTFSQPHGGGGPGGGPVAVRDTIEPFLPSPTVVRDGDVYRLDHDRPKSIGRVRGFAGPFGVFVRAYAYMRAYGPGLKEMSEAAVLNANYVLAKLKDVYDLPYDRLCMHEFVLSARALKREHGITALDVAKRLMDYGIHPPTIYFPLVVPEALMIEPTETEPKERLDDFVDAMRAIAEEAATSPELLHEAPHGRPVRRLDEVRAAKQPVVRYAFDEPVIV
ncbi:MAG: aminomethyl-transferring glycine dehydrogenase subunit GcvPB [Gaiellaceae bacterium]